MIVSIPQAIRKLHTWVFKIGVPFWVPIECGTYYLGYPKRDHNFDNHPYRRAVYKGQKKQSYDVLLSTPCE